MAEVLRAGEFYGETESVAVADARISIVTHRRGVALPLHTHESAYFCLLLEGQYEEESQGVRLAYEPFTIAYHPPSCPHVDAIGPDGAAFLIVELGPSWLRVIGEQTPPTRVSELTGGPAVWLALRLRDELRAPAPSELVVESVLLELCGALQTMRDDAPGVPPWFTRALDLVSERYRDKISVRAIADAAGVHPVHLARTFRRARARTLGDHIQRLRVLYACERMQAANDSLAAIAQDAGFTDQAHFTHVFRTVTGTTPGRFRSAAHV